MTTVTRRRQSVAARRTGYLVAALVVAIAGTAIAVVAQASSLRGGGAVGPAGR